MNQYPNDPTTGYNQPYPNAGQMPPPPSYPQPGYPPQGQPGYPPPGQYTPPPPGYPQQPMPMQQPPKKSKKGLWITLGIIIGAVVLCAAIASGSHNTGTKATTAANNTGSSTTDSSNTTTSSQPPPQPSTQHFKPGDTVKVGDTWEITISNVRSVPAGQYDSLKSGDIYIGMDVNIKNVSAGEASLYGNADWTLKDTSGQKYDNAYVSDFPDAPDGKIEPGDPAKGSLIFEVPAATHDFRLAYEQNMFESGQVIWDLSV